MKKIFRNIISRILEWQVKRLQRISSFKTFAVVGSIGKTSTKLAISHALGKIGNVQYQSGNYNDRVTVPLIFFGHNNPSSLMNPLSWLKIIYLNEKQLRTDYQFDYVVLELGTDGPGQISKFSYLDIDLVVVTAVTPEHMEYFNDLDAVAEEELSVAKFAKKLLVNSDLIATKYLAKLPSDLTCITYGTSAKAHINIHDGASKGSFTISMQNKSIFAAKDVVLSLPKKYTLAAILGVMSFLGISDPKKISAVLEDAVLTSVPGRLQQLPGIHDSIIIDDTYNSSPEAVKMALDVLYSHNGAQKIAILGSMNELGAVSESAHKEIGKMCKPQNIDLLVTIGTQANKYLAPEATKNGCTVHSFTNPYEAGMFIRHTMKPKSVILAKGSQNGVFAEEALKSILKNSHDQVKLVRQSDDWLMKKKKQFESSK